MESMNKNMSSRSLGPTLESTQWCAALSSVRRGSNYIDTTFLNRMFLQGYSCLKLTHSWCWCLKESESVQTTSIWLTFWREYRRPSPTLQTAKTFIGYANPPIGFTNCGFPFRTTKNSSSAWHASVGVARILIFFVAWQTLILIGKVSKR